MNAIGKRFKFDLPAGWDDQSAYHFKGPDVAGRDHLITLYVDRYLQHETLRSYVREKTDPILSSMDGIEVLKDEEVSVEGGHPVWEWVYRWIPGEGLVEFHKYVFVIADGMGFMFNGRFSKRTHKTVGRQFKDVVEAVLPGTYEPIEED